MLIVAAHPDDESVGSGATIAAAGLVTVVHVTDGAKSGRAARRKGFKTIAEYARVRIEEVHRAFSLLPVEARFVELAFRNRRAAFHIADITKALSRLFLYARPDLILTHAFEGGHPDHDATAMAVHLARRLVDGSIPLYEMTGYHSAQAEDVYGSFMPRADTETIRLDLTEESRAMKTAMLGAFVSQRSVIARFPLDAEMFRRAPHYDFTVRPHPGPLYYERHRLGMRWRMWRFLAGRASRQFGDRTQCRDSVVRLLHAIVAAPRRASAHFLRQPILKNAGAHHGAHENPAPNPGLGRLSPGSLILRRSRQ